MIPIGFKSHDVLVTRHPQFMVTLSDTDVVGGGGGVLCSTRTSCCCKTYQWCIKYRWEKDCFMQPTSWKKEENVIYIVEERVSGVLLIFFFQLKCQGGIVGSTYKESRNIVVCQTKCLFPCLQTRLFTSNCRLYCRRLVLHGPRLDVQSPVHRHHEYLFSLCNCIYSYT